MKDVSCYTSLNTYAGAARGVRRSAGGVHLDSASRSLPRGALLGTYAGAVCSVRRVACGVRRADRV
jgi:hypothetical protein